jgi:hypothetical protein
MFPLSFIFFSLITHIYFSLLENYLRRTVRYLSGCYQYYRSKSILLLKLYESSNVISIENLNQNDRNKMNNIYQPEKRKPRLLDLVSQKIQTLHYSRRTEKTYIGWIKRFILFHRKRHPVKMGEPVVIHSDIQLPRIFLKTDMISEQFKNSLRIRMFKQQ